MGRVKTGARLHVMAGTWHHAIVYGWTDARREADRLRTAIHQGRSSYPRGTVVWLGVRGFGTEVLEWVE